MKQKTKVILVDDHSLSSLGLASLLGDMEQVMLVGVARDGKEALELLKKEKANLLITDVEMPGVDGIKLSEQIQKKYPKIKLVVLSVHKDRSTVLKMMGNGAVGYLHKGMANEEIIKALEKIIAGGEYFPENIQGTLFKEGKETSSYADRIKLTRMEEKVLPLFDEGLTNQEAANRMNRAVGTIKRHKQNMMLKAGVNNTPALLRWARDNGYLD